MKKDRAGFWFGKNVLVTGINGFIGGNLAKGLLEFETLSGDEVEAVMRGEQINRKDDDDASKAPVGSAVPTAGRPRPREEPGPGGGLAAAALLEPTGKSTEAI